MAEPVALRYRAFISYAHADEKQAKWLHKALESFPIDKDVIGRETALGTIPKTLRPIFRDRDDFSGGHELNDATIAALDAAHALVVLCSTVAATRPAVNEEARLFRARHPGRPVIPLIIEGTYPDNFPPALRFALEASGGLSDRPVTILGPDLRETGDGRDLALAKVVAGLTGLAPDDVFRRAERERRRQGRVRMAVASIVMGLFAAGGYFYWDSLQKGATIAVQQQEKSQALSIAQQLLGANPAAAATPGQEQSLVAALTAIQENAAKGDAGYAKAFELLKAGKGAEAEPLLRAAAERKAAKIQQDKFDTAAAYRNLGAIAGLGDPKSAREAYAKALEFDSEDMESLYWHGKLLNEAGDLLTAEKSLGRLLELATNKAVPRGVFRAHWELCYLMIDRGNLTLAGEHAKAAVDIARLKVGKAPDDSEWQTELARGQTGSGDVLVAQGQLPDALKAFRDSLTIRESLAKADPGNAGWQRDVSVSYNKVGDVLVAQGQLPDALKAFRDSLAIRERLAKADPGNAGWQRDLAVSNERVGDMYAQQAEPEQAAAAFKRALGAYEELTSRNPDDVPSRVNSVVPRMRLAQLDPGNARGHLVSALKILKDLADQNRLDAKRLKWIPGIEAQIAALEGK